MPTGWCPKAGYHMMPDQLMDQINKGPEEKLTRPYATAKQTIPANEVE